jgi:glycosyltransferase involved in cell wall biosynthesis
MRILMCNSFYYLRGGAERCFFDLTKLLTEHGHEVIPFSMHHPQNFDSPYADYFLSHIDFPSLLSEDKGISNQWKVAERTIYSYEAHQKIKRLIRDVKPDIAHIHGIAHETSPSILPVIKQAGIPIVQTLHDYKLLCPNTNFVSQGQVCEQCKGHRYYNVIRRRCKRDSLAASMLASIEMYVHKILQIYERNVDTFISPSHFLKSKIIEFGIQNQVVHIPNFVDVDALEPNYLPENYFVYAGRLVAVKGVHTLLKAMRQIKLAHLYVAGIGELDQELRTYAQKNGITNITFLGQLSRSELVPLVQKAAFTVAPSEWYENNPMTVLESFACGTPVIGARIGGIPELVNDGYTGLLFKPGNADELVEKIQYMLNHPQQATEMGRAGRAYVENVTHPEKHYHQTIQLYQALL